MEVRIASAKTAKFGFRVSGDTVEVVERPRGGLTAILSDGQGHGPAAKRTSSLVSSKAQALVADGARDGAVARAVHDFLYAARDGKVSADLTLITVDLSTRSLVVSRNANAPVFVRRPDGGLQVLDQEVEPIGVHAAMKPTITEFPLEMEMLAVAMSDGVYEAGKRFGQPPFGQDGLTELIAATRPDQAERLAETILSLAMARDEGRPADDMTVVVVALTESPPHPQVRRMTVHVPLG